MITKTQYANVFMEKGKRFTNYYTINLTPGKKVYGERLVKDKNLSGEIIEYREWDVTRSKLGAAIAKVIKMTGIKQKNCVLYLGAASGTTVSHVSDIVTKEGFVFAIDFAPRPLRDLVFLAEERKNIAPILADCNHPEEYQDLICESDAIIQDIAQRNQVEIFQKNLRFLKKGGYGLLVIKARSIDVTKNPRAVFMEVDRQLQKFIKVIDVLDLHPFEKDHCVFLVQK